VHISALLLVGEEGLGLASRSLPLTRAGHRLAILVARMLLGYGSGVLVPQAAVHISALLLVGEEGLEPSRIAPYASETYAYTSSATRPEN
jgi:hypothetical protein